MTTSRRTFYSTFTSAYYLFRYSNIFKVLEPVIQKRDSAVVQVSPSDRPAGNSVGTMVKKPVKVVFLDQAAEENYNVRVPGFLRQKTRVTTTSLEGARQNINTGFTTLHWTVLNQFEAGHMVSLRVD